MFGDVVYNIPGEEFEQQIEATKKEQNVTQDVELTAESLSKLVTRFKGVLSKHGKALPQDPWEQLVQSISAVFLSYNTPRAIKYREINKITSIKGTAANVQSMGT
ncbi:hypothetical protein DUNSADRAFT_18727 [Dunaliella salina]|uniref:Uncharacterized protein n=1 Tax=Dunaliella salina TaxID=3046 RepID=A0ABQ7GYP1_DUNSA|nr:hypothetical protein DUNSADRAFT_18727 [Dunaliella salina]|eukprot:KAF5839727.1 hypothetical protein DUNSADRAFT_18727 [Dunaliella salina]